jgi:glutamate-1-semialdehyde 2,1-aminomutase
MALHERARRSLAGGVSSSFRRQQRPVPLAFAAGSGARLRDLDGNEYIDHVLGWGPVILGHSHPRVVRAVCEQVMRGQTFGAQHELEPAVAEKILSLVPATERVCFASSGTEAVQVALRLARAHTGRQKVIKFEGHYHGWSDAIFFNFRARPLDRDTSATPATSGQSANAARDVLALPWNDLGRVEATLEAHRGDVAAIITEPLPANSGMIPAAPDFLAGLRRLCDRHDVALIFDEVITGFRVALGGARALCQVVPDVSVFGKAIAGGFPLSALAGRRELLDLVADGRVAHAGTLNGNPVVLAAAAATLDELSKDGGAALRIARESGEALQARLRAAFARRGRPLLVQGVGSVFWTFLTDRPAITDYASFLACDGRPYARFVEALLGEGVFAMESGRWYMSTVHGAAEVEEVGRAAERALAKVGL